MAKSGPPPKPTRLKILNGNPGKRKINKREPIPAPGIPTCPTWLSAEAKVEWRRIVPRLSELQLLTRMDRAAFAAYCQAWAELREATRILEAEGRVLDEKVWGRPDKEGDREDLGTKKKLHPAVKMQRDAFTRVKQFLSEFGLTPASRSRFEAPQQEDVDEFQEFARGKKA